MGDYCALLSRQKADVHKLTAYGFQRYGDDFIYVTDLIDGLFTMTVTVIPQNSVSATVMDKSTGEDYVLHRVASVTGSFVGRIRDEYDNVLRDIVAGCFIPDVFKGEPSLQAIHYIQHKYHNELEFLWPRFPDNAIFRRSDNGKWYGAILIVEKNRIGLEGNQKIEIIDLRMSPEDIAERVDGKKYFPGFHMNKKHWVTICLDGTVPADEIFMRIDASYRLAAK